MKNKQSERSIQWLTEALLTLMETTAFESINIKDITEKAGVARLTFYRHFETKEQILLKYLDRKFNSYLNEFTVIPDMSVKESLCYCFKYWEQDARLTKLLVRHKLVSIVHDPFGEYLRRVLETNSLLEEISYFQRKFLEGGLLSTMIDWVQEPKGYTPEDMADMVLEFTKIGESKINIK